VDGRTTVELRPRQSSKFKVRVKVLPHSEDGALMLGLNCN